MRFTLSKMFLAVAMLALACAAMTVRNHWWADAVVTITVLLYAIMALRAIGLRGRERVFAIVFAVVGGSYLLLEASDMCVPIRDSMPTRYPLAIGWKLLMNPTVDVNPFAEQPRSSKYASLEEIVASIRISREGDGIFFLVGHCVWSWLLALLAGWFAGSMYARREVL